jgi:hypothetical protein
MVLQLYRCIREKVARCIVMFEIRDTLFKVTSKPLSGFESNAQHTHTKRTASAHLAHNACAFAVPLVCVSSCFLLA